VSEKQQFTTMQQYAPYPTELDDLVGKCAYRPGWTVALKDIERDPADTHGDSAGGLTLVITTCGYDSYHPDSGEHYRVHHYTAVPAATFNRASWQRWLFDQFLRVEQHECMEFFAIEDNHPYAATHGPGDDPYVVHEVATETQRATSFRGLKNLPKSPQEFLSDEDQAEYAEWAEQNRLRKARISMETGISHVG
jgi:hypothetical protein